MRGKDSFLDEITEFASGFLEGLKGIQDAGRATGGMLLQVMQQGFNLDHIKFEGDLSTMSSTVKAEVQLTVAGRVINEKIDIDLLKEFADLLTKIEEEILIFHKGNVGPDRKPTPDMYGPPFNDVGWAPKAVFAVVRF